MRKRREVELASTDAARIDLDGNCSCEEDGFRSWGCDCLRTRKEAVVSMKDDVVEGRQLISLTPSLVITIESPFPARSRSETTTASSPFTTNMSTRTRSLSTSSTSLIRNVASTPHSSATTILTVTIPPTHSLSPRSSSATHTFTPTGIQAVVPTYPPFTTSSSSSSTTSTSATNWSSLGTKLGLGLGIPILVLLTLLLTAVLYRRQARLAKQHHHRHHESSAPEMATATATTDASYPRLHPVPSSRFSAAGDVVVTPAQGIATTPAQLYFPLSPNTPPSPPAVPRRSSARLLAGPLDSHPPVRPASSIYEGADDDDDGGGGRGKDVRRNSGMRESSGFGGNGVGNVLAEYLDLDPQHLDGPWNTGREDRPAVPLPPAPVARNRQLEQRRQYLSVDVHHSPGGIDEISPLSSSSSGPFMPARISAMSGLSPSSPVRPHSKRRI